LGKVSTVGLYAVQLCVGGSWQQVWLDDYFPCSTAGTLAFSGARRQQLFAPLLEKALAKVRGCYEAIEGGSPAEGLQLLTGWPSMTQDLQPAEANAAPSSNSSRSWQVHYPFESLDMVWTLLESAHQAELVIVGSCGHVPGISREMYIEAGLSPSHCYSLVRVFEHQVSESERLRLVCFRNPWGTGRIWKGDYGPQSPLWTRELRETLGENEEGVFWMPLSQVKRYFVSISISCYRPGWSAIRFDGVFPGIDAQQPAYLLTTFDVTEALVAVMQDVGEDLGDIGFTLFRCSRNGMPPYIYEGSVSRSLRDSTILDTMLGAHGEDRSYLLVPYSLNMRRGIARNRFVAACYTSKPITVTEMRVPTEVLRSAIVQHAKRKGTPSSCGRQCTLFKASDAGLIIYLENTAPFPCVVMCELDECVNMVISRGENPEGLSAIDTIPSGHGQLLVMAAGCPGGWQHRVNISSRGSMGNEYIHSPELADRLHAPFLLGA
jgi:hypothetical protein